MRIERVIPVIAVLLMTMGILSTVYVHSFQEREGTDYLKINGKEFGINDLFNSCNKKDMKTSMGETHTGISLADIVNLSGVENPGEHIYTIIAADGYSKTVEWNNIKNGIFTEEEKRAIFSDLPKQFWVRNIVEIKVI
ncbi:MAG: hypothetical protein U9O96_06965 [Candidatus Thermoplasmatota archaeon]|nr:hypothetical protein [Candidatus Thermoplasmatota archaeon]